MRIDCNAHFADFAQRERMVGVHADLGWQVERDGKSGLSPREQIAIALVRFRGAAESGILAHCP